VACPPYVGGPPISYQQPVYVQPPYVPQGQQYPRQPTAQTPAPPKVRFQKPDDPPASERRPETKSVALTLPTPEQLGIGSPAAAPANLDMNALNNRLDELGAESTEWVKTPEGYRFTCKLASADRSRTQRLEAEGPTRAEAARVLLARAEQWAQGK
jgi:hypothetical protein